MKSAINKYTKEVEDTLNRLSLKNDKAKADKLKKYIGTNLNVLGLITKTQVDAHKSGFSFYSDHKENTFLIFNDIYKQSNIFEVKNQAFIFLDKFHKHIPLKTQLKTLPSWTKHVDNWAHSDSLSKYLTKMVENDSTKSEMLSIIKKWNSSKNLWERRQSLIALYYYARTKKQYVDFELTQELVFPLLNDKEYFVQKAVGWTLRESYNVYPKQTFMFIEEHVKNINPAAFTTCVEKMSEKEKQILKFKRKKIVSYKYLYILLAFVQCLWSQKKMSPEEYIAAYKEDAIKEMYLHKVPACITLAQGMLESGNGNSALSRKANNHFGIKCHKEWGGETYTMDDDSANECFRKYDDVLDSYSDHSMFLFSRSRYASLFELPINDYKGWCYGLKASGYATDPKYPERLIELIEKYKLQNLNIVENTPLQNLPSQGTLKSDLAIREVYRFNHIKFVIAKENDSFYKIAHDFNLELDEILEYNDLSKTDKLSYGQKIYIEKKRRRALEPIHVVQKNETLKSIAQLHGIRLNSLCKKNRLKSEDKLKVGDVLYLRQKKNLPK